MLPRSGPIGPLAPSGGWQFIGPTFNVTMREGQTIFGEFEADLGLDPSGTTHLLSYGYCSIYYLDGSTYPVFSLTATLTPTRQEFPVSFRFPVSFDTSLTLGFCVENLPTTSNTGFVRGWVMVVNP